jgi:hypothetical protein
MFKRIVQCITLFSSFFFILLLGLFRPWCLFVAGSEDAIGVISTPCKDLRHELFGGASGGAVGGEHGEGPVGQIRLAAALAAPSGGHEAVDPGLGGQAARHVLRGHAGVHSHTVCVRGVGGAEGEQEHTNKQTNKHLNHANRNSISQT